MGARGLDKEGGNTSVKLAEDLKQAVSEGVEDKLRQAVETF